MLAAFSDAATLRHALAFEAELARAEAAEGLIDTEAAEAIAALCASITIDPAELAEEAALAGTLAIPLVARLRAALSGDAAKALHKGATSQDVADTVLACQIRTANGLLDHDLSRITTALAILARRHAATPAIGRTLLQDALPIGFGLRITHWQAGVAEAAARLRHEVQAGAALQFGGAAGSRAGLGGKAAAVSAGLAAALGLPDAPPWHARRGGIAGIAAALAIAIGALGKMARDVSLLAQNGIAEAREPAIPGRGGSSAMAHKRNPTGCQVALSASLRAPGLVAGILAGLPAEQERGLGGWQAEGPALADLFLLAAGAADAMATVAEGLEIDEAAIARNLAAAGLGNDIGESATLVAALLARDD
ncbi:MULTISPECIES: lyase family protein [Bosea]|uniref:lyase family protein n=1 Tax=Bosea TaxID=85413 RepID=UPI00215037BE|nr:MULTISPECIES: lyase family protein [Bosea]MCR4524168.1 lyase family protein [Bosea sp. 47.2.35]MDR6828007.1 3-carboxy-cis,cis-muconate cycloisomerase [Bosea robiniae]MDR6894843.1 3-carboxy-cis,cis-muconate cycloisomerase [Bosea sp. BE109]MDR7138113.1 3-carboxy-cis,cis-muconate cycloisomerase [Bosea sp. BE168]MDR7174812.1 3-carboxy-cis,cis-muconate cycloisomerase [Bosea sp. BE271]